MGKQFFHVKPSRTRYTMLLKVQHNFGGKSWSMMLLKVQHIAILAGKKPILSLQMTQDQTKYDSEPISGL
jgi:hypothetical protein